jgi:hypothetical protein
MAGLPVAAVIADLRSKGFDGPLGQRSAVRALEGPVRRRNWQTFVVSGDAPLR